MFVDSGGLDILPSSSAAGEGHPQSIAAHEGSSNLGCKKRSSRREQCFVESLRDQLNRQIAQLDYQARRVASPTHHLFNNLPAMVWMVAFFFAIVRINPKPSSDPWTDPRIWVVFGGSLFLIVALVAGSIWMQRRWVQRDLLPRQRRLEALLKEIDGQ